MAEFDGVPYPNLDFHDQRVYLLAFRGIELFSSLSKVLLANSLKP